MRFKTWLEATDQYIEKKIDPALLTWEEFYQLVNPSHKHHSSDAYDVSLADLNEFNNKPSDYPTLLYRKIIKGIQFEFRMKQIDRYQYKFVKSDANGKDVTINGELQYYTPEELAKLNTKRYDYDFGAFTDGKKVAVTQDEWGALLVMTAREYRGFGLGKILTKLAWEHEPGKDTGGVTPAGSKLIKQVHAEFVREYLRKGFYSSLVKDKVLTAERVKQIISSIDPSRTPTSNTNLNTNDPKDFLLYMENGCFVLYDQKLKDLIEQDKEDNHFWYEKCIKGISYAGGGYHSGPNLYLHQLGGDSPNLINLMLTLALSYCALEGCPLHVYDEDVKYIDQSQVLLQGNLASLKSQPMKYQALVNQERMFRKSFDRYDEFKNQLIELAESKYK